LNRLHSVSSRTSFMLDVLAPLGQYQAL